MKREPVRPNGRWVGGSTPSATVEEKSAEDLVADERRRVKAMGAFLGGMVNELSRQNREQGGDGNVAGVLVE